MSTNFIFSNANGSSAWSLQSLDNAAVGRVHDGALLMQTNTGQGNGSWRSGILPGSITTSGFLLADMFPSTPSGLNISITPGNAVVWVSGRNGPYLCTLGTTGSVTLSAADPTNPRIDRVDLQVSDNVFTDGSTQAAFIVTTGTPAGSPSPPAAPVRSIPICQATVLALGTTISVLTDTRTTTALTGTDRPMATAETLATAGFIDGERRRRRHATYGILTDYWDAAAAVWRGTKVLEIAQPALSAPNCIASFAQIIGQITLVDPGWPYHVVTGCAGSGVQSGGIGAGSAILSLSIQIDNTTFGTNQITNGACGNYSTSTTLSQFATANERNSIPLSANGYTGSHTLYYLAESVNSNIQFQNGTTTGWHIQLIPA